MAVVIAFISQKGSANAGIAIAASDLSSPHETPATAYAAAGARWSCSVATCRAPSRSVAPRRDRSGLSRIAAIHWQGSLGLVLRRVSGSPVTRRRLAVRKSGSENEDRSAKRAKIRALNDAFRTGFWGGRVMMTAGVAALENPVRNAVVEKINRTDIKAVCNKVCLRSSGKGWPEGDAVLH